MMLPDVVRIMAETLGRTLHDGTLKSGPDTKLADPDKGQGVSGLSQRVQQTGPAVRLLPRPLARDNEAEKLFRDMEKKIRGPCDVCRRWHSGKESSVIGFRDFVPQPLNYTGPQKGLFGLLKAPEFETFEEAVASANAWIARDAVRVIHLETVILPHIYISDARDVGETGQAIVEGHKVAFWEQFVRVWYEVE
jgi:hypothetical protein